MIESIETALIPAAGTAWVRFGIFIQILLLQIQIKLLVSRRSEGGDSASIGRDAYGSGS